jgi:hypothetical protein
VIGMPADEVVLAPLNSVLKTSSGKIRRNASRDAFERGLIGARVAAEGSNCCGWRRRRCAPAWPRRRASRGEAYGLWCWTVFLLLALPVLPGDQLRVAGDRPPHRPSRGAPLPAPGRHAAAARRAR